MKKKFLLSKMMVTVLVFGMMVIGCKNDDGPDPRNQKTTYFQSLNNISRNARNVSEDNIEFFVSSLIVISDIGAGAGALIAHGHHIGDAGVLYNTGWYDVAGINRQVVYLGDRHQHPHSVVELRINGIRINETVYSYDNAHGFVLIAEGTVENKKEKIDRESPNIRILSGDITKLAQHPGDVEAPNSKYLNTFAGVNDLYNDISEFIVVVDEAKLHEAGELKNEWWHCFSFIAR